MPARLRAIVDSLKPDVYSSKHQPIWDEARARHPVLRPHSSVQHAIDLMMDASRGALRYKDILTRVFIAEKRRQHPSFWCSALVIAYYPMLSGIRRRIWGDILNDDDFDQLVISAFLLAIDNLPIRKRRRRTFLSLRQFTQQYVFKEITKNQREEQTKIELKRVKEASRFYDPSVPRDTRNYGLFGPDEAHRLITGVANSAIPKYRLDLIFDTYLRGEGLKNFVKRTEEYRDEAELDRVYQRLKRQRLRTIERLQKLFKDLEESPNRDCLSKETERLLAQLEKGDGEFTHHY